MSVAARTTQSQEEEEKVLHWIAEYVCERNLPVPLQGTA